MLAAAFDIEIQGYCSRHLNGRESFGLPWPARACVADGGSIPRNR